jgi:16S rRNA (guanine527-N7)-methyltransferase
VTSAEFADRLRDRVAKADLSIQQHEIAALETYFRLLARWNAKINLTALPLSEPTDDTFDRLFVEPLTVAPSVPDEGQTWFDLGSGGGSPALPLKIARPSLRLTMVESKSRKTAFLREAARELGLESTEVLTTRMEDLPSRGDVGLVSVRAVRQDDELFRVASRLLSPAGRLLIFHSRPDELSPIGFNRDHLGRSFALFHVEQKPLTSP